LSDNLPPAASVTRNRDRIARIFAEQPGLVLTAGYLVLTALGLGYQFAYFHEFRVNILDFAEVSDFLLAALREPAVLLLALAPLPLLWLIGLLNQLLGKFFPRYHSYTKETDTARARAIIHPLFIVIYFFLFVLWYAEWKAGFVKRGQGNRVGVTLQATPAGGMPAGPALLLGKTSGFIFLYYVSERRTHVIPLENLARIVIEREVKQR
jgi:hypothetical protein